MFCGCPLSPVALWCRSPPVFLFLSGWPLPWYKEGTEVTYYNHVGVIDLILVLAIVWNWVCPSLEAFKWKSLLSGSEWSHYLSLLGIVWLEFWFVRYKVATPPNVLLLSSCNVSSPFCHLKAVSVLGSKVCLCRQEINGSCFLIKLTNLCFLIG